LQIRLILFGEVWY